MNMKNNHRITVTLTMISRCWFLTLCWIYTQICFLHVNSRAKTALNSLLVWDSFQAHLVNSVKWAICQTNTNITAIPGGLTSILQPLDVPLTSHLKIISVNNGTTGRLKARRVSHLLETWDGHRFPLYVRGFWMPGVVFGQNGSPVL